MRALKLYVQLVTVGRQIIHPDFGNHPSPRKFVLPGLVGELKFSVHGWGGIRTKLLHVVPVRVALAL